MGRFDAAVVSPSTSAGAFVVTTKAAVLYGVCASGSSADTVINVYNANTAGRKTFILPVTSALPANDGPYIGVVCPDGIVATNVGTLVSYVVYYANIE